MMHLLSVVCQVLYVETKLCASSTDNINILGNSICRPFAILDFLSGNRGTINERPFMVAKIRHDWLSVVDVISI